MNDYQDVEILLVEDSDSDAEMTLRALRKGKVSNKIFRARDGVEALEFIFRDGPFADRDSGMPRLIMLDVKMPRLGGLDVLRRLKTNDGTKSIPVVMLTSSAQDRDLADTYRLGVNSYLVKPVDIASFTSTIIQAGLYWLSINRSVPQHH